MSSEFEARARQQWAEERDRWLESEAGRSGARFSDHLRRLAFERDDDAIVMVAGREGCGKSTFALQLAIRANVAWNPWDHLVFEPKGIIMAMERARRGTVLLWDEAGAGWFSRDAMKDTNKDLGKAFTLCRDRNLIFLFTAPRVRVLDANARSRMAYFIRLNKKQKGTGTLYEVWEDEWEGLIGRTARKTLRFNKLPDNLYRTYREFKRTFVNSELAVYGRRAELARVKPWLTEVQYKVYELATLIASDGGVPYQDFKDSLPRLPKGALEYGLRSLKAKNLMMAPEVEGGRWRCVWQAYRPSESESSG